MGLIIQILNGVLPLSYAITLALYGLYFFQSNHKARQFTRPALLVTVIIHLLELCLRGYHMGYFPAASLYEIASILALAITLIYLYIETRLKIKSTGFFVLLIPLVLQTVSSLFIDMQSQIPDVLKTPMFIVHTSAATLGYCGLFIASFYSGLHLLLYYNLKRANFGNVYRKLPSLEEMSNMSFSAALLGFIFLSMTIFQGVLWRKVAYPETPHFDPQVIASYITWTIYGVYLVGKKTGFWSEKRLSYIALAGFVIIILSVLAVDKLNSFHQFG